MTRAGKPCPIKGCTAHAKPNQLMCWPHWRRVPKALNRAVFETYADASGRELGGEALREASARYRQARDAAIAAVEAKEAKE
ncbi:hypothetical protein [Sphingomonas sp. CCH9-E2]|uniref:hypothetical protein n=1 Tax=Sphingomonas sp. CCH9-E2 TaxID=1768776 RepID=UPI000A690A29|nr:hypothetical protein [Sphingomonas sp. CCH9-E2]